MAPSPCPSCGAPLSKDAGCPRAAGLSLGTVVDGRFELVGHLGHGQLGVAYEALPSSTRRPLALKLLHPGLADNPAVFEHFHTGTEPARRVRHPNLAAVHEVGRTAEGHVFYTSELLFGVSLQQLVEQEGSLPLDRTVAILEQVTKVLAQAHREGVVHGDLQPHNVMVQALDGADFVKVLDLGLLDALGQDGMHRLVGGFLPPEVASGQSPGPRSDVWSVCALLHFCLTGRPPGKLALAPLLPEVASLLESGLSTSPEQRFADAEHLLDALMDTWGPEDEEEAEEALPLTRSSSTTVLALSPLEAPERAVTETELPVVPPSSVALPLDTPSSRRAALIGIPTVLFLLGAGLVYSARERLFPRPERLTSPRTQPPPEVVVPAADVEYEPLPSPVIRLVSDPAGATVTEGDNVLGRTPLDVALSPEREYFLTFRLPGHDSVTRRVSPAVTRKLDVRLTPERPPKRSR